jgi:hypothetical protein
MFVPCAAFHSSIVRVHTRISTTPSLVLVGCNELYPYIIIKVDANAPDELIPF